MFGVHQLPCCCAWIYFYFLNTIVLSYFFFIKCMNLSDVTIASSAWPMSSPPKRHYISFIWYVHVEFLLAKKILTELLFILAFMFIYSRVFGWNSLFWICTICTSRRNVVECTLQNICILMFLPSYSCQMNMKEEFLPFTSERVYSCLSF